MAYGEAGELSRGMPEGGPKAKIANDLLVKSDQTVSRLLEIDAEHVRVIVFYFDVDPEGFKAELERWLQARNVNVATVTAEAQREAQELKCPFHLCHSRHFIHPDSLKIL